MKTGEHMEDGEKIVDFITQLFKEGDPMLIIGAIVLGPIFWYAAKANSKKKDK